jgi:hypothetical protein
MTRMALYFLGRRISSASIHYMTDTWVLRATDLIASRVHHASKVHLMPFASNTARNRSDPLK